MASFFDQLTANIRAPVIGLGVDRGPCLWILALKQILQREMWNSAADKDVAIVGLYLNPLAIVQPGGFCDFAWEANDQALSPLADSDCAIPDLRDIPWRLDRKTDLA